jgi:starvation-inducible DNA-binding protein
MDGLDTIKALEIVLADSYALYLKTQNYHWNVTGIHFRQLHLMFEEQYKELATPIDNIAERIRALGSLTPASFDALQKLTTLDKPMPTATAEIMLEDIMQDQEKIIATINKAIAIAKKHDDEATITLLADRLLVHDKNHWMIAASLGVGNSKISKVA